MAYIKQTKAAVPVEARGLEEEKFELALENSDDLISIMVGQYSIPVFSSLREVVQNALDAGPGDVHVTLPSEIDPHLTVSDRGCGLSADDMRRLLKRLGASDKKGNADKIGDKGIGSVAPMCLAESMTISSYKDGRHVDMHVWKDDAGYIRLAVNDAGETKHPNGTRVVIPYPQDLHSQFTEAVEVFRFSPEVCSRLYVNGEKLEPHEVVFSREVQVGDHQVMFRLVSGSTEVVKGALVLLNGMPMGASLERFPELKDFHEFLESHEASMGRRRYGESTMVIVVPPLAGLAFTPSREYLAVTRLNSAFLGNACAKFLEQGLAKLEAEGLTLGCESAVLTMWKKKSIEEKKGLRQVMTDVQKELDGKESFLRVELSFSYWAGNEFPVAVVTPRIPSVCHGRVLQHRYLRNHRSGGGYWTTTTAELVPMNPDKPELGHKYPFGNGTQATVVTWTGMPYDTWTDAVRSDQKARQLLFELGTKPNSCHYGDHETLNLLLLRAPLPDGHPLKGAAGIKEVDLAEELKTYQPSASNPFLKDLVEEDEDGGSGPRVRSKVRHPRPFLTSKGVTEKIGLPKGKPFLYVSTLRDNLQAENYGALPVRTSWGGRLEDLCGWIEFMEDAGIVDGIEAVALVRHESRNILREHIPLVEGLSLAGEAWFDQLSPESKDWLAKAMFVRWLEHSQPHVHSLLLAIRRQSLDAGKPAENESLRKLLEGFDEAPCDESERFVNAWTRATKAHFADGMNPDKKSGAIVPYFLGRMDRSFDAAGKYLVSDAPNNEFYPNGAHWTDAAGSVFGIPSAFLHSPARLLQEWLRSDEPLAGLFRLWWRFTDDTSRQAICSRIGEGPLFQMQRNSKDTRKPILLDSEVEEIAKLVMRP